MEPKQAIQKAVKDGFKNIVTFMGPLSLDAWLELTTLKEVSYERGRIITPWIPSILEKGKMERLVFVLE